MIDAQQNEDAPLFDAVLVPHRSLGPLGFLILMVVISTISFVAGLFFLLEGAWPVFGFFGLDVLLIYIAFRANYRSGHLYETIRLTRNELSVERRLPGGHIHHWTSQPYWLRVQLEERLHSNGALTLSSHGRAVAVGAFLSPRERSDLAKALRSALAAAREPFVS
jgi:uncharacterized membrane protein